jgi:glycerol-1-phosphate dehydrogenase [NAD(P)+]
LGTIAILKLIGEEYGDALHYLRKFHVDIHPGRMGIDEDTFVYCMQHAASMRNNRYTYLHEVDLHTARLQKLYRDLLTEL